jgi:hypothetical protein
MGGTFSNDYINAANVGEGEHDTMKFVVVQNTAKQDIVTDHNTQYSALMRRISEFEARLGRLETAGAPAPLACSTVRERPTSRRRAQPNWHGDLLKKLESRREKIESD